MIVTASSTYHLLIMDYVWCAAEIRGEIPFENYLAGLERGGMLWKGPVAADLNGMFALHAANDSI